MLTSAKELVSTADTSTMALHDRLKPPTLEAIPARASHTFTLALVLAVLAAGFAFAMPRLQQVSAETEDAVLEVVSSPTGSTHTTTATPSPSPTDEPDDGDDDDGEAKADNHGKVVSTAAHCDIKGRAHGELVRSIAQDKDATVADAEAACAAAIAAQEAAGDEPKSNNGRGHEAKAPKPEKPERSSKSATDESGGPGNSGGNGKGHGKP